MDQRAREIRFGAGTMGAYPVVLAKPQGYMNRSGPPVRRLCHAYHISQEAVLVIHDDIDISFGNIKIKEKGGHGGHKGVRSLMEALGGDRFIRIRVGIGRPETATSITDHVLGDFALEEYTVLNEVVQRAKAAVICILRHGTEEGMNRFNTNQTRISR
jgi:PTH1 family peptidyl-tRNA hydrolase